MGNGSGNSNGTNGTLAGNREAMNRFLAKMRDSGNVRLSCQAAGIPRTTVYRWRDKWSTFAAEWDEAKEDACDILEGEAWKRAVKGQSDRLLMFLLKAHRREVYGDSIDLRHGSTDGGDTVKIEYVNDWRKNRSD